MPWCEQCSRFFNPNSVAPDGTCVHCGAFIGDPDPVGKDAGHTPWHFWVLLAALVIYLGYRAVQGVIWAAGKF